MNLRLRYFLKEYVVLIIMIIFIIIASFLSKEFLSVVNITNLLRQTTMVIIVGCAVNLLMVSGGVDLSVGSIVALSAIVLVKLVANNTGFPLVLAIIIAILAGLLCGLVNAFLIVKLNINALISTLGTLYIFRGLTFIISDSKTISTGLPDFFEVIGQGFLWKIPNPVIIMIFIFIIFLFLQDWTTLGKYSYAIGGNLEAARLSGVPIEKVQTILYVLVGLMSGITGVIVASRAASAGPLVSQGFEFDVILAVLLGGTVLGGGGGSVKGMLFGALLLSVVRNGMNLLGLESTYKYITTGAVFVLAILLNKLIRGEKIINFK